MIPAFLKKRLVLLSIFITLSFITLLPSITSTGSTSNRASIQQADKLDRLRELYRDLQAGAPFSDIEAEILRRFASGEEIADIEAELVISRAHYLKTVLRAELSQEQEEILRRYEQEIISQRILPQAPPSNDNCGGAVPLQLNIPVTSTTLDAVNDYQLSSSMACFSAGGAIGNAPNTATGRDVVYSFTAPDNDTYSFRVTSPGVSLDRTLFLSSSCPTGAPPITIADAQCIRAANRRSSSDRAEEIHCVPLLAGQTVYLFIDDTFTSPTTGQPFTVEVIRCRQETESNDTPPSANAFSCGISGRIQPNTEADFISLGTHPTNSRLFAIVDGGQSSPATTNPDYDLRVTTSTDTLEYDQNNNIIEFGSESPSIAGTPLPNVPVYLRISASHSVSVEPYRVYIAVRPPSSSAIPEIEPNNSIAQANSHSSNYFTGVIQNTSDVDIFAFNATVGTQLFLSASADPDRDNTPFNIRLELLNSSGNVLLDAQDAEATSNTTPGTGSLTSFTPNFPGESILWRAQYTGTYYARVRRSGGTVPNNYLLSIAVTNCGISCSTFPVSPGSLPGGMVGMPYSQTISAGSPGTSPFVYYVTSGSLPPGLTLSTLNSVATLSGTPTTAGTYNFTITAADVNNCQSSQTYTVTITGCPTITLSPTTLPNGTVGTPYSQSVSASGGNAPYTFSSSGTLPPGITFNTSTGAISGIPTAAGSYTFTITATDVFGCTGSQNYTVTINCPTITLSPTTLPNGTVGTPYSQSVSASGGNAPYTFSSSGTLPPGITFNTSTGAISGIPTAAGSYTFTITATDVFGCTGSQNYTVTINCPTITLSPTTLPNGTVGTPYSQSVSASGGNAPYTFSSSGTLPPGITFNTSTGAISGIPTAAGSYTFTITATDVFGCTGSQNYTVTINCPTITLSPTTLPNGTVGTPYSQSVSASGGNAPYTFSSSGTLPPGITFNTSTGAISGIPTAAGSYTFTITATDVFGCTGSQNYTVTINCPTITLSPTTLPNGTVGTPYSQSVSASGGNAPYTFSSSGTLPPGITFNTSTGAISGIPTAAGSYTFTITATDVFGCTGSQNYTVTINCPTITLSPTTLPNGTVGTPYSQSVSASGGNAPYTFSSSGTLPPGITFNTSTGAISGIPTAAGSYTFTITATDVFGCTGSQNYTVTINCPTITLSPTTLPNGTVGTPYSQSVSASGGNAPYTFSSSGTLPPGITFNTSTGAISGIPTAAGSYTFTITATDVFGCTGSQNYTVTINCPTITLSPTTLPNGTVGTPYSQSVSASGGNAPYTFSSSGTLPPGITFNTSTGAISGIPTAAGSYTFTITATDVFGCTGSQNYTVTINCPTITLSPTTLPNGTVGTPYSQSVSASGGNAPYTFSSSGTLPPGITFNTSTGAISGIPTAAGSYTFTITATDVFGCTGSQNYTVTINCPTITLSPTTLPNGTVGTPYSQSVSASGGNAPYTFSSSGTLPPGITFNTSTGAISGIPTAAGSYTFTITATDVFGCTGSQNYTVTINCPTITLSPTTLPNGTVGTPYSQSVSASGGNAPYTFSSSGTLPPGITFNTSTGAISGIPTAAGSYTFTITATDVFGCTGSQNYTVTINCPTITLSPTTLPNGTVGTPYSQSVSASGGNAPYTFSSSGTLPPGITFNTSTGAISGIPTAAGSYTFTITATDVFGCTGSQNYTVTINCPTITLSPTTLPNGTVGTPYSQSVSASGGNAPYTFSSSGTLPPGITFNTSTGAISGIPTAAGSYTFTITATDVFGCTGSRTYTVTVACPTITITPTTLPPFTVGVSYSQTLTASGGTAPYTFTLSSGSLPPGISLSPSGTISGIATAAGSYTFTVTATDVYGCTGSITLTLSNGLEHLAIYVADTNNHRIQRTTDDGATWQVVADGFGATAGKFNKPQSVSADSTGNVIFVADTGNNRIQRSTDGGSNWEIISAGPGVCAGCFNSPQGVAYDEANNKLYISDTNNHRIQVLSNAATVAATSAVSSWTIMSGTGFGTVIGKFNQPSGIAVDASGKVYVADTNNHRIQAYDGNNWSVFAGTSFGAAPGKLNTPRGIYVDTQGRVWIADTENSRVQVWNSGTWSVFMPLGATAGSVNKPEGLAVAASGNLFVSDATHRIQKKPTAGGAATIVGTFGASPGSFHLPGGIR
ncbi:MAG: putative Ig domain-containing protein [Acidobacteriota bacterium]|nr:putative Ig domain-containing protein [Acidobacteriota bacterium]